MADLTDDGRRVRRSGPSHGRLAAAAIYEPLEARLTLSVSAAELAWPLAANTLHYTYEAAIGGGVAVDRVVGATTFNGIAATEVDETASLTIPINVIGQTVPPERETLVTRMFTGLTDAGEVEYGSISDGVTTSYSPARVIYPAEMVAGQTYASTTTATYTGGTTAAVTDSFTLASDAPQPVDVGGATCLAYEITDTENGTAEDLEVVPGIGLVSGPGRTLFRFSNGPAGAMGSDAAVEGTTLPSHLVADAPIQGRLTLSMLNEGTAASRGADAVVLYASTDLTVDAGSVELGSVTRRLAVRAGGSASVSVPLRAAGGLPDGAYEVLAVVTDPAGNVTTSMVDLAVTASPESADVVASVDTSSALSPGRAVSVVVDLDNTGNIAASGPYVFALYLSPTSTATGTPAATVDRPLRLGISGNGVTIRLRFLIPSGTAIPTSYYTDITATPVATPLATPLTVAG